MSTNSSLAAAVQRLRLRVRGVVQGVGFRPFVYSLAQRHTLTGLVGNDSSGVFVEVQGSRLSLDAFTRELLAGPPPLAHIEDLTSRSIAIVPGERDFVIVDSESKPGDCTP